MTPGLARFAVAWDAGPSWDEVLAGVLSSLRQAFTTAPERGASGRAASEREAPGHGVPRPGILVRTGAAGGTGRHTWLDTFDWLLYRAGLRLAYVTAPRGGQLVLADAGDGAGPVAVQPVAGWRAARPHLAADLPDGPVARRIGAIISPRALLPVVTTVAAATVTGLLNADGKTVARLLIERPSAVGAAGHPVISLPPRLAIAEVRGYPGQARRAARLVALTPGVETARARAAGPRRGAARGAGVQGKAVQGKAVQGKAVQGKAVQGKAVQGKAVQGKAVQGNAHGTLLDDALRGVGRRPCDYSNKVDAAITAASPAPRAVAAVLLRLLDILEANTGGVARDTDTEFLHDLRVSVRRTRAALKLFGDTPGLPVERLDWYAAEFKWLGDLTTPVRDLDVHLLGFGGMAAEVKAARKEDLDPFRAFLAQRRAGEFRVLARGVRSDRFTQLMRDWRADLTAISGVGQGQALRQSSMSWTEMPVNTGAPVHDHDHGGQEVKLGKITARGDAPCAPRSPEGADRAGAAGTPGAAAPEGQGQVITARGALAGAERPRGTAAGSLVGRALSGAERPPGGAAGCRGRSVAGPRRQPGQDGFRLALGETSASAADRPGTSDGKAGGQRRVRSGQSSERELGTAGALAVDRTRRAFRKVVRRGGAITPASPHESLHDLRKRCKELRYALEFFAPLYDRAAYARVLGDLKKLQDCLGEFQDNEVQIAEIRALAQAMLDAGAASGSTVPARTLLAMGEVTAALAVRQAAARAVFERRFAGFAGRKGQRRMAALLRSALPGSGLLPVRGGNA